MMGYHLTGSSTYLVVVFSSIVGQIPDSQMLLRIGDLQASTVDHSCHLIVVDKLNVLKGVN